MTDHFFNFRLRFFGLSLFQSFPARSRATLRIASMNTRSTQLEGSFSLGRFICILPMGGKSTYASDFRHFCRVFLIFRSTLSGCGRSRIATLFETLTLAACGTCFSFCRTAAGSCGGVCGQGRFTQSAPRSKPARDSWLSSLPTPAIPPRSLATGMKPSNCATTSRLQLRRQCASACPAAAIRQSRPDHVQPFCGVAAMIPQPARGSAKIGGIGPFSIIIPEVQNREVADPARFSAEVSDFSDLQPSSNVFQ